MQGGQIALRLEQGGAVVAAGGFVTSFFDPPAGGAIMTFGGGMMAAGGGVSLVSNGLEALGGAAQLAGGASSGTAWSNIGYGLGTFATSLTLGGMVSSSALAGTNAAQRLFNSKLQLAAATAGAAQDTMAALIPAAAPTETGCGN